MYWQVYLHKTVISAEYMLVNVLDRAKCLAKKNVELFCSPALRLFLYQDITKEDFSKKEILDAFAQLDDIDILGAIKVWVHHEDKVLSTLSKMIVNRNLLKIKIQNEPYESSIIQTKKLEVAQRLGISEADSNYFVYSDWIENNAYNPESDSINILFKNGDVKDITEASDNLNIQALAKPVRKYFICFPEL